MTNLTLGFVTKYSCAFGRQILDAIDFQKNSFQVGSINPLILKTFLIQMEVI